jgi:hypothetical protein
MRPLKLLSVRSIPQRLARRKILRHRELAKLVMLNTPSTGANFYDYWLLYSYIRRARPREVLELGPGITTLVIAQALSENGSGRVTAMEDVEHYHNALREIIPDRLRCYIDLHLSPSHQIHWGPFRGKAYKKIPDRNYDLVWIDGPNYDRQSEFDADIFEIVSKSDKPITAFVDSRMGSCFIYSLVFGRKFKFDYIRRIGVLKACRTDMKSYSEIFSSIKVRGIIYGLLRV